MLNKSCFCTVGPFGLLKPLDFLPENNRQLKSVNPPLSFCLATLMARHFDICARGAYCPHVVVTQSLVPVV